MTTTHNALQFVVTCGPDDPDRARFALNAALVAAVSGLDITVYLALRAAHWACAVHASDPIQNEVRALLERLREHGAAIECCSTCMEAHCAASVDQHGSRLDQGVQPAGLIGLAWRASSGAQTITF